MNRKERRVAKKAVRMPAGPRPSSEVFDRTLRLHQAGNLSAAESLYRQILALEPDHADAMQFLGLIAHQAGQHEAALELIGRAIALNDQAPHFYINLGEVLRTVGRLDEAAASHRRALALMPDSAEAYNNLGNTLDAQGKLDEAVACYERAVALRPSEAGMLYNFATALLARGDWAKALTIARRSLRIAETPEIRALLGNCIREMRAGDGDPELPGIVARALSEAWARPQELAAAAALLVKESAYFTSSGTAGLSDVADDALLQSMLENVAIPDLELEAFLTRLRSVLLDLAAGVTAPSMLDAHMLRFCCALARQCFINEYLYDRSTEELGRAQELRDALSEALGEGRMVSPLWVAAVAAYFPLRRVSRAERLFDQVWPDPIVALLTQQLREPAQERALTETVPSLTPIADRVSLLVRNQYEENPYPRWVKPISAGIPASVDGLLRKRFPQAPLRAVARGSGLDVLVAGCGTGQHSIETAQLFAGARMLAVDLSRASLAYAKRQTQALGLVGIEYAQADILELGALGRSFDLIESSGVLHHLADPMAGWRVLVSLLRPGGLMWLGFYSALARQGIVAARGFIAARGFGDSADDIRRARRELIAAGAGTPFEPVTASPDFYSISGCRDLLFHVQEHRLTLLEIAAFLAANELTLIGIDIDRQVGARYQARFPADRSMTDLACWHQFETENPSTFRGMYQFWVQKKI